MLLEELERVEGLRGAGAGDPPANLPGGVTDPESELEVVRLALDAEQTRHAVELQRHEAEVFGLLARKSAALAALARGDTL